MKKTLALLFAITTVFTFVIASSASVWVKGYYRSNGTYVSPHYRSNPDSSRYNNWSSWGNYNPYTGVRGYKTYRGW